ncbi:MAG TPA: deoxyribodipyrimidine photo-lyase [Devosia sp.]|nr:deoxyribodipyrimidine photo-lyase [Devosia sp.]
MAQHALIWLRDDLRLSDNPALHATLQGERATAVYIIETGAGNRPDGGAARWWRGESLARFRRDLDRLGIPLRIETGDAEILLPQIAAEIGADSVVWNRRYHPAGRRTDAAIKAGFAAQDFPATSYKGNALVEPFRLKPKDAPSYSVCGALAKAVRRHGVDTPIPFDSKLMACANDPSIDPSSLRWEAKLAQYWKIGEAAAHAALERFLSDDVARYPHDRDRPGVAGTSMLSPHLRFGEISARQIWHSASARAASTGGETTAIDKFLAELTWRDFNIHLMFHRPDIASIPMREVDEDRWRDDPAALEAWKLGQTGFPIIDAGMRQLWQTGFMHNRVRMLTASLLTKNLLIDWRIGESWFWDTLVDADPANNPGNWQWVAGCGMDAAPYFRIFNPVLQGEKFDTDGAYVRRWVPELAALPSQWVHQPFAAPPGVLATAGVVLGQTYPWPIIDLLATRRRTLARD